MSNDITFKKKYVISASVAAAVLAASLLSIPMLLQQQTSATLTPGTCHVWASNEIQDKSSWYVAVCNPSVSGSYKSIELAFPPGYDVRGVGTEPIDQKGLVPGTLSVSGQVVKFTLFSPITIRSGSGFKLEIGHVINPTPGVPATYSIPVTARDSAGAVIETFTQTPPTVKLELINSLEILDHSITAADLKAGAVGTTEISDGSVSLADLAFNSVNSGKILDGSIALTDLATNSVNSGKIVDGSIIKSDVSNSFIKVVQLADDSAGNAKGWNPNGASIDFTISDIAVQSASAIGINIDRQTVPDPPIPVGDAGYYRGVDVNQATNRIYVTNSVSNSVSVIDGSTNTVIGTVAVDSNPFGVAVNPNTNRIYSANVPNSVSVIDGSTNALLREYPLFGCEVVDRNAGNNFKIKCASAPINNSKLSYSILS